jgi:NitT/TauT family transport system permease protein
MAISTGTPRPEIDAEVGVAVRARRGGGDARLRTKRSMIWYRIASYAIVIGIIELVSGTVFDEFKLPAPSKVAGNLLKIARTGELWVQSSATLQRVGISMVLIFIVGGTIGLAMGFSRWWEDALRDLINTLISIPGLVFVLICLIVFGLRPTGAIVAIVLTNASFVAVQMWEGIRAIPRDLISMSQSYKVSRARTLRHVILPALAPFLFTALTYSFALTWKLAMLTELFGSSRGVGFKLRVEFAQFDIAGMLSWALTFYIFAILVERLIFQRLSRRFFRWRATA